MEHPNIWKNYFIAHLLCILEKGNNGGFLRDKEEDDRATNIVCSFEKKKETYGIS